MSSLKIYKASAGSGKTYTLAREYIKELLKNDSATAYRHILAVTFTKDATGEMKDRILSELYGIAFDAEDSRGFRDNVMNDLNAQGINCTEQILRSRAKLALNKIIDDYSRLNITTIDSFFQKILRNLARELGKGSRFNIELNTERIRSDAVNAVIEHANENPQLLQWLTTYAETKLEERGNWHFKTEVYNFTDCIYKEFFQMHERDLRRQLEQNPTMISDLNKRHRSVVADCRKRFREIYEEAYRLIASANLNADDFNRKGGFPFWEKLAFRGQASASNTTKELAVNPEKWAKQNKCREQVIALAESNLCSLMSETLDVVKLYDTSTLILSNIHQLGIVWFITKEIENSNHDNNRFMLSDTAQFLNEMIDLSDAPFIFEKIGAEIRNMLIDEFQDTSQLQWQNFRILLNNLLANNTFNLLVGDVKQSIYRWRNGDWRILNKIPEQYGAATQTLENNFRSEQKIVEFNNSFFTQAGALLNEKLKTELTTLKDSVPFTDVYGRSAVSQKPAKQEDNGFVSIDFLSDEDSKKTKEAALKMLIDKLHELRSANVKPTDICILTRINSEIKTIASYFSSKTADYPDLARENYLNIVSNDAFQLDSSIAVTTLVEALKAIAYPENPVFRIENNPPDSVKNRPLLEMIFSLFRHLNLERFEGQSAYLFCFFDSVMSYVNDNPANLHSFLEYWDEELYKKTIPTGEGIEGIRAMTIHKSKGLQFHTVIVPYCTWMLAPKANNTLWCGKKTGIYDLELLPVSFSSKMNETLFVYDYQEEMALSWLDNLNLMYVAFTRAEQNLLIFGALKKKLTDISDIRSVSDILQMIFGDTHYESGEITNIVKNKVSESDNILKQSLLPMYINFVSEKFQEGKPIFRQSNKSKEFFNEEAAEKGKYIAHGNVMHALFERIIHLSDIEKSVDALISEGSILPVEREKYINDVKTAIKESGVEDWFSDKYRVYPEFSVLIEEKGEVTYRRPDRVLLSDTETIVIDYKFGEPHPAHNRQVRQYIALLKGMNYPNVTGFLWYVTKNVVM